MKDSRKTNNPAYFLKPIAHEERERTQLFSFQQSSAPGGQSPPLRGCGAFQLSLTTIPSPSHPRCLFLSAQPPRLPRGVLLSQMSLSTEEMYPPDEEKELAGAEEQACAQGSSR